MAFIDTLDSRRSQNMFYSDVNQSLMAKNDLCAFYQSDHFRPRTRSMTNPTLLPVDHNSKTEAGDLYSDKKSSKKLSMRNNLEHSLANSTTTQANTIDSFVAQTSITTSQKPRVFLPRRKIKRVPVTSCDTCRLRKLRCNSKELGEGKKCGQCTKSGIPCTFEDRDEMLQIPKTKTNIARKKRSGARQPAKMKENDLFSLTSSNKPPLTQSMMGNGSTWSPHKQEQSYPMIGNTISKMGSNSASFVGTTSQSNQFSLSHYSIHPQLDLSAFSLSSVPVNVALPWQSWNLPSQLTEPQSGTTRSIQQEQLIDLLIHRFYDTSSFCSIILPDRGFSSSSVLHGSSNSIPQFLLLTVLACAAWSGLSNEPELIAWRELIWSNATQSVHDQLNSTSNIEIELIQALLLLCITWPGDLVRVERINTLDAAVGIATRISLQSRAHSGITLESQTIRLSLFWTMYCFDKILCSATGRVTSVPSSCHDMPLPTSENLANLGIDSQGTELAWLQRLSISFIKLCQLLEEIQSNVFEPIAMGWMSSLQDVLMSMQSLETKLEQFCREHRWFLGNISSFSAPHKNLAEAVITQMHLTQLHLYLAPLKFESAYSPTRPMTFSILNQKALTATIESSWHLIQQASQGKSSVDVKAEKPMNLSYAALHFGANAFKFLSTNWAQWQGGAGCVPYAPRNEFGVESEEIQPSLSLGVSRQDNQFLEQNAARPTSNTHLETRTCNSEIQGQGRPGCSKICNPNRTFELARLEIKNDEKIEGSNDPEGQILEMPGSTSRQNTEVCFANGEPKSSASLLLCTPARLLFQDVETLQNSLNCIENADVANSESNGNAYKNEKQMDECPKIHAMLAPLNPELVNEMSKLESLLFPGGTPNLDEGQGENGISVSSDQLAGGDANYVHGHSFPKNTITITPSSNLQLSRSYPDSHYLLGPLSSSTQTTNSHASHLASIDSNSTLLPRISQQ